MVPACGEYFACINPISLPKCLVKWEGTEAQRLCHVAGLTQLSALELRM